MLRHVGIAMADYRADNRFVDSRHDESRVEGRTGTMEGLALDSQLRTIMNIRFRRRV